MEGCILGLGGASEVKERADAAAVAAAEPLHECGGPELVTHDR